MFYSYMYMYHTTRICYECHICELEGISKIKTTLRIKKFNVCVTLWLQVILRTTIILVYQIQVYNNFVVTSIIQWALPAPFVLSTRWNIAAWA